MPDWLRNRANRVRVFSALCLSPHAFLALSLSPHAFLALSLTHHAFLALSLTHHTCRCVQELAVTAQLVTLHKWRFSAIHAYVCGEQESPEGGLEEPGRAVLDLDRMMRLVYMSSALSENKSLRLDGMIQQVRDEIEDVTAALRNGEDVEIQRLGRSANCRAELSALHWSLP